MDSRAWAFGPHRGRAAAGDPVTLQLKWRHQFQFAGYYAAEAKGYYAAQGLDVKIMEGGKDRPPVPAVLSGSTDVVMPKLGGAALVRRVRESRPEIRVLYMSGYTSGAISKQGVLEPGSRLIEKPFTSEQLARAVREALDADAGLAGQGPENA